MGLCMRVHFFHAPGQPAGGVSISEFIGNRVYRHQILQHMLQHILRRVIFVSY